MAQQAKAEERISKFFKKHFNPSIGHYTVQVNDTMVRIRRNGREVLYWERSEWEEDASLLPTIANAVRIALRNPAQMDKKLRAKGTIK